MYTSSLAERTERKPAPVLQLVPPARHQARETAQALREMADLAERGEIIGFAYVALRPNRRVTVGTVGVAAPLVTHWLERLKLKLLEH